MLALGSSNLLTMIIIPFALLKEEQINEGDKEKNIFYTILKFYQNTS